jgi:hypothetical protein
MTCAGDEVGDNGAVRPLRPPDAAAPSRDDQYGSQPPSAMQAIALAQAGCAIFATTPGRKTPHSHLAPHGLHDATSDLDRVTSIWSTEPLAGIGFPTGTVNGLSVVDLDVKRGMDGIGEYLRLCDFYEIEPSPGLVTHTPSGGMHIWYRTGDEPVSSLTAWADGIDVRGDGAYVVVPPSVVEVEVRPGNGDHPRGGATILAPYRWGALTGAPPIPQVLLDGIRHDRWSTTHTVPSGGSRGSLPPTDVLRERGLRPGSRNDDMHALAARLFRQLPYHESLVLDICREVYAATTQTDGFTWDEAQRAVTSARRFVAEQRESERWQLGVGTSWMTN